MDNIKVSIIVPIFNNEEYIERCLESLINQTHSNIEMICVNDGSTDNSQKILNSYKEKDERVIIINKENGGVSSARNAGIDKAQGTYIMFVDGDDWIELDMVYKLLNEIVENNADIVRCSYVKDYIYKQNVQSMNLGVDKLIIPKEDKRLVYDMFMDTYVLNSMCCQLIKTSIIKDNNIKVSCDYVYGEDARFNQTLYTYIDKVVLIDKPYYHYFYNSNSATTIRSMEKIIKRINDSLALYTGLYDWLKTWNIDDDKNKQKIANRVVKEFICRSKELFTLIDDGYTIDEISKQLKKIWENSELQKSLQINNKSKVITNRIEDKLYIKDIINLKIDKYIQKGIKLYKIKKYIKKLKARN